MQVDWRASTWNQFGAAIDMFSDAIHLCPDDLWQNSPFLPFRLTIVI